VREQDLVADAVRRRGYYQREDGTWWEPEQLACRQVAKLTEELAEMSRHASQLGENAMGWQQRAGWEHRLEDAGDMARTAFDRGDWAGASVRDELAQEAADLQVVLFTLADALDFDVVQLALDKSREDVRRGVR